MKNLEYHRMNKLRWRIFEFNFRRFSRPQIKFLGVFLDLQYKNL